VSSYDGKHHFHAVLLFVDRTTELVLGQQELEDQEIPDSEFTEVV